MNKLVIKANGLDNLEYRINFNDSNVNDLIVTIQELKVEAVEILMPKDTPAKVVKTFLGSITILENPAINVKATLGVSQINDYVKGGFPKGDTPDNIDYWKLRGYLEAVRTEETTLLLTTEIAEKVIILKELTLEVNTALETLSEAGQLCSTKSWYDIGTHHHTMRSGKSSHGILGVLDYEAHDLWQKQLKKFNK